MGAMPDINKTWVEETLAAVHFWWGEILPWQIAREINIFLWRRAMTTPKADGTPRNAAPCTTPSGSRVIWKAWELGLFEGKEWRDQLMAIAKQQSKPYLDRGCRHDLTFGRCRRCYLALDVASVILHYPKKRKFHIIELEAEYLNQFLKDLDRHNASLANVDNACEIWAVREPGRMVFECTGCGALHAEYQPHLEPSGAA
jgi:hypothetical protein